MIILIISLQTFQLFSQDIPLGTWRSHLSYREVVEIDETENRIYALTTGGLYYLAKEDNSIVKLSSVSGLRRASVTAIASLGNEALMIGYDEGEIDILTDTEITGIEDILLSDFPENDKKINHIRVKDNLAYVSTGFGVVVFNTLTLKVVETYWQLDTDGESLEVYASAVDETHLVLATEKGLMVGDLSFNLLDFNNWDRYFGTGIASKVELYQAEFHTSISGDGLYKFDGNQWIEVGFSGEIIGNISSGGNVLWVLLDSGIYQWDGSATPVVFNEGTPLTVFSATLNTWVGSDNGLYRQDGSQWTPVIPDGPFSTDNWSIGYEGDQIFVLSGGYDAIYNPLGKDAGLYIWSGGNWENFNEIITEGLDQFQDPVQVTWSDQLQAWVISVYGQGLLLFDGNDFSDLTVPVAMGTRLSGVYADADGLWVADTDGSPSLYHLDNQGNWNSFSLFGTPPFRVRKIVSDRLYLYFLLDPILEGGIIMVDKENGNSRVLDTQPNQGDFPGIPTAIALDREDRIWVGTTNGVAYLISPFIDQNINAFTPVNEFVPLLRGERIADIEVDAGNRKWITTGDGVFLVDARGEEELLFFNESNSPLLSEDVSDVAVEGSTGELFFITSRGLISYRSDATTPKSALNSVKIFPNPVPPGFEGLVSISGLLTDTFVKITDASGNLVWETESNGGTASWDVHMLNGKRPSTGMYYVFLSDGDGAETFVGKIAIIR